MRISALIVIALLSVPAHAAKVTTFNKECVENEATIVSLQPQPKQEALVIERTPEYTIYGKYGSCPMPDGKYLGWLVGYVERLGKVYYYALNLDGKSLADFAGVRLQIVKGSMQELGFIPPPPPPPPSEPVLVPLPGQAPAAPTPAGPAPAPPAGGVSATDPEGG